MNEIWKPVVGYEGLYEVSNIGRVRSLRYKRTNEIGLLTPHLTPKGYLQVCLQKGNKSKYPLIHRLVAEAFIENPNNYPCINHKSEVKTENTVGNLEWCSYGYNASYGTRMNRIKKALKQPIIQCDKNGKEIFCWFSTKDASESLNINRPAITQCLRGRNKTSGGYMWKYKGDVV